MQEIEFIINQFIDASKNQNNDIPLTICRNPSNLNEAQSCGEACYYWIRKQFNAYSDSQNELTKSAMFLFLNNTYLEECIEKVPTDLMFHTDIIKIQPLWTRTISEKYDN